MKKYPVIDRVTQKELKGIGFVGKSRGPLPSLGVPCGGIHAVRTGEFRAPKAGEWYLSGATVEAYRAPNDLSTAYHIARLVVGGVK